MKEYVAEVASVDAYQLAEGPVWDDTGERVLWVDIAGGNVYIGTLDGDCVTVTASHHIDDTVGAVAPTDSGDLLVAGHHAVHLLTGEGHLTEVSRPLRPSERRRFNDGACDPGGRFLVGTLSLGEPARRESLYQIDPVAGVSVLDDDLALSNGIAWSPDGAVLYTVDTTPGTIWARSYDATSGKCGERHVAFSVRDGSPDGICVDTDGNLWVAIWGRGEVRCFSPRGQLLATVLVKAPHVSSVAFVGPGRDRLLITTARDELSADDLAAHPASGHLFLADVPARGATTFAWS
ncbi:SMP-30/gluconolactonase/LRE family protein [Actinomadura madurae]|uniref:SMP-30/gluconolactonase/LRE family protein n=1 Tax=Actinomadura madurae TaxID=1993 RepID=UPI000D99FEDA|nr:SMP-30/gluconolactonase/LRE family protein [Actinomadura madurae]SPT51484.1 Lactonase drp35 [Actinomadura madurae]